MSDVHSSEAGANPRSIAVVVVHGIGDQVRNATVQQAVAQFSRYYGDLAPVALGGFSPGPVTRDYQKNGQRVRCSFSEVYWADIPRRVAASGYTLEETKAWARSIVERLEKQDKRNADKTGINYPLAQQVVGELIETIGVLERLTYLADKAGIFEFDLNQVLVDYLDDVQVVAEFKCHRERILDRFNAALSHIDKQSEIYIVAHSEGTVVSFLGLLDAIRQQPTPPWLSRVRGYLTIGSPIDKHLVFWPELFDSGGGPYLNSEAAKLRIQWRNYYDYGDPIGCELDYARYWLKERQVTAFKFEGREQEEKQSTDDVGFARYLFPGKAHTDYWNDNTLFDHFIGSVIHNEKPSIPSSKIGAQVVAYLASYLLPFLILSVGVFLVCRSVSGFGSLGVNPNPSEYWIFRDTLGITCLLAGTTVLARIPRLTNPRLSWVWSFYSIVAFAIFSSVFWLVTTNASVAAMGKWLSHVYEQDFGHHIIKSILVGVAFVIAGVSVLASRRYVGEAKGELSCGATILVLSGGALSLAIILPLLNDDPDGKSSLTPVFLSLAFFVYSWWLAILLFDLVFVWHRYIRHEVANKRLERNLMK